MYNNSYGGGGGYMQNSSPRVGSQGTPGGERKNSEQSVRPVTIRQILNAEQAHADAETYVDGIEVKQVSLVAQVISITKQTTNSVYFLDDGTGRLEGRLWLENNNDEEESSDRGIKEQTYVRVTGLLKTFGSKKYVNATNIRPCDDPHEVYYHMMEVIFVSLALQRGHPSGSRTGEAQSANGLGGATGATNGNYSAYTTASTGSTIHSDQYAGLSDLARRIIEFIVSEPRTDEGVHVAKIAKHVMTDAGSISTALDELMDNGHVFSTIDESHFSASA